MNPLNYASLPASQRLQSSGIVLETEAVWHLQGDNETYFLQAQGSSAELCVRWGDYPAPSMAEVWRELRSYGQFPCSDGDNWWLCDDNAENISPEMSDINPTDALIDLLIRVRKESDHADN